MASMKDAGWKFGVAAFWAISILGVLLFLFGSDASRSRWSSYGDEADVTCYSGGAIVYDGKSTGKVSTTSNSDGWEFREAGTNTFIRVSGDCVVRN